MSRRGLTLAVAGVLLVILFGVGSVLPVPYVVLVIAYGWIEQNTGVTPLAKPGVVASCYRITPAGLRALRLARCAADTDELAEAA